MNAISKLAVDQKVEIHRIHSLDYLRGLMAFLIAVYHYIIWVSDLQGAASFFGRIGVYGVSIFYILSGLTLYLVYKEKLTFSTQSITSFYIRRFFRIYPLLWVSMGLTIWLNKGEYTFQLLFLSFTGLFGFVAPSMYIGGVTWSIGNELVFYSLFPFLVLALENRKRLFYLIMAGLLSINLYFIFYAFDQTISLFDGQWGIYVNPFNHVILFVMGILLGYIVTNKPFKLTPRIQVILWLIGIVGLFFYPASGDLIHIVQGWARVFLTLFSCLICLCFYISTFNPPRLLHRLLENIGQVSYSIYLIHPVCFIVLIRLNQQTFDVKIRYVFLVYILVTLVVSNFLYYVLEKPMIKLG
ncbi:acyltransferase, partial [Rufibacter sp. H-1]